ncbi:FtsX-like permease family protein [Nocardioides sp. dk4132]|uniref:ABC transporter permease n=1 Tax=unclassified Nocardioides TaxID=2615069 RepID=UPI001295680C|nr:MULTISPECIES: FtsX-like permease family protein [unclassified Nocardioides]MQW76944.1 FtsX-like permease family protein [Nocardioides sp. dk4132]QGA09365.1 FtsX-like permease family protein [Nocardioides sp. dk884]
MRRTRARRLSGWVGGWRVAVRLAWRESWRAKRRAVLMVVMIMLPVLAVTATAVVLRTADVSVREGLDRRLGAADAQIVVEDGVVDVEQGVDPDKASGSSTRPRRDRPTLAQVREALGRDVPALETRYSEVLVDTRDGVVSAGANELDATDPLAAGLFDLTDGRFARSIDEVVITEPLAKRGLAVGDEIGLLGPDGPDGVERRALSVVGIAHDPSSGTWERLVGLPGSLAPAAKDADDPPRTTTWLVGGGPVTWQEVRTLNALGAYVLSRAVVEDPPAEALAFASYDDDVVPTIIALVVVMILLEVVLLAGPAFAVGARRQARTIALVTAAGGTPAQARRVVLGTAVVVGGLSAVVGIVAGLGLAAVTVPLVQRWSGERFGPFDLPWLLLLLVAGFGVGAALLAAAAPAWIASRQNVVAVLGGRRGEGPASLRFPLLGLVLLGLGLAGAATGGSSGGEVRIAGATILAVVGMALLVPVVVTAVARLGRALPLPLRYAVRDAARHRSRTVPAVSAVAATVCGVVALGIATASDEAENAATYTAALRHGAAAVTVTDPGTGYADLTTDWVAVRAAVERQLPGVDLDRIDGVLDETDTGHLEVKVQTSHGKGTRESWGASLGAADLVDDSLPAALPGVSVADRERADRALAAGGAVGFSATAVPGAHGTVRVEHTPYGPGRRRERGRVQAPVAVVRVAPDAGKIRSVLSPKVAEALGLEVVTVGLTVAGSVDRAAQRDIEEALGAIAPFAQVEVERGYERPMAATLVQVGLGVLGAVLMLAGTLTATSLALSDARGDLATLAAVGAAPRLRRAVAASYALVVGLIGSVLGAAVGFVPGWAVSYPLTYAGRPEGSDLPDHFLDVPWLLIGAIVVGLPLLTAALVAATTRGRLPMVTRID